MGLLRVLADKFDPIETRDFESSMLSAFGPGLGMVNIGMTSPRLAENLAVVTASVNVISSSVASLPTFVYRYQANARQIDDGHPLTRLIEDGPNDFQSWPDFLEWLMASTLLRGNGLAEIVIDGRGAVVGLKPIPFDQCNVQLLRTGRLVYDVTPVTFQRGTGRPRRLLQSEVLHLRDRSDDGILGVSRLRRAAAAIQSGLSMQDFALALYQNGVNPSGSIESDQSISPQTRDRLTAAFRDSFSGTHNTAKALVLDNGMKWKQISISPEDAEFLSSRKFGVEEIARVFGVPAPMINDHSHSTFTNSETLLRFFAQGTLSFWCRKIEAEFSRSVFSESTRRTHRVELDLSGLLRGDPATRWASWKTAVEAGILSPDEVRLEEGWGPRGGNQ